jgi:hypothetical protein
MNVIFKPFKNLYNYLFTINKIQLNNNIIKENIINNKDTTNNDEKIIEITVTNLIDNLIDDVIIKIEENHKKNIYIKELLEKCNTGDIILFQGKSIISEIIKLSTNSVWTHIGIIIKNPKFIKNCKKGIYLYVADGAYEIDKPSNKKLIGVQLVDLVDKLKNYEGTFYYRKLITNKNKKKMMNIFSIVYNTEFHKFYDWLPQNWIATFLAMHNLENISDIISNPRHLDKMFCSSLVAYTYTQWKFLNKNTEWSFITPQFFADIINLDNNSFLEPIKKINL